MFLRHTIRPLARRRRTPSRRSVRAGPARRLAAALGASVLLVSPGAGFAFEDLNEAQALIYDRAHLATLSEGDEVVYRYEAILDGGAPVEDTVRLEVQGEPDEERRDVTLDFLSGERHLILPSFEGYRGNPVLIAMLEHISQSLAATSGGGALYFRNRIRDGIAGEAAEVESASMTFGDRDVETTSLAFEPFRGDAYLGARPGFGDARFRIVFSDDVPGGVISVAASSGSSADAESTGTTSFDYELRLSDAPRTNREPRP